MVEGEANRAIAPTVKALSATAILPLSPMLPIDDNTNRPSSCFFCVCIAAYLASGSSEMKLIQSRRGTTGNIYPSFDISDANLRRRKTRAELSTRSTAKQFWHKEAANGRYSCCHPTDSIIIRIVPNKPLKYIASGIVLIPIFRLPSMQARNLIC